MKRTDDRSAAAPLHIAHGRVGEKAAEKHLREKGYRTVARNLHLSHDEIDLIVENKDYIVFVEVKTRAVPYLNADGSSPYAITPAMAVNREKQRHLYAAASRYLLLHPTDKQPRLDVVEVYLKKSRSPKEPSTEVLRIHHIENAFGRG